MPRPSSAASLRISLLSTPEGHGRCFLASTASMTTPWHAPSWAGLPTTTFEASWITSSQTMTPGVSSREQ